MHHGMTEKEDRMMWLGKAKAQAGAAVRTGFLLPMVLMIAVVGCSKDDNGVVTGTGTVSGTLTYPAPAAGAQWLVIVDNDFNGDNGWVASSSGTCGSGTTMMYSVTDVPTGTYYVYALVRVVSGPTDPPQDGDYLGIHGGSLTNSPQSPTASVSSGGTVTCDITLGVASGM
jgi:hypothetical protein